jgi:Domain of unknown function (DUF6431)
MIREFTIFCKLNLIKLSAEDLFWTAMLDFSAEKLSSLVTPCPFCGAKHPSWTVHGVYSRYLISFEKGAPITYTISVSRLICSSCGHTNAILPEIIIPYGSYSLIFILTVLRDYFLSHITVQMLCDKYQISPSTLYAWKRLFLIHKKLWLGFLKDMSQSSLDFLSSFPSHNTSADLELFFINHAHSFLQGVSKTASFSSA